MTSVHSDLQAFSMTSSHNDIISLGPSLKKLHVLMTSSSSNLLSFSPDSSSRMSSTAFRCKLNLKE
ncbi:hypothetical protein PGT21_019615 [Puccinia graminis f. sp. tritici]|uniref:Uncharacterized protein n=1 Tax=Puccinia graminis f. sp. tritici TaxID=56615 RepID=A0A5B0LNF1_PUCGR|nr:hypothetical protein PGT21_019615 [Puccinia graminis f. sp. tritici]